MKKEKPFLYQINFNRSKYPEICEALEEAKEREGGIAWYLRQLISRDIEEKKGNVVSYNSYKPETSEKVERVSKPNTKVKRTTSLPDDNGGFV